MPVQEKRKRGIVEEVLAGRLDVLEPLSDHELNSVLQAIQKKKKSDRDYDNKAVARQKLREPPEPRPMLNSTIHIDAGAAHLLSRQELASFRAEKSLVIGGPEVGLETCCLVRLCWMLEGDMWGELSLVNLNEKYKGKNHITQTLKLHSMDLEPRLHSFSMRNTREKVMSPKLFLSCSPSIWGHDYSFSNEKKIGEKIMSPKLAISSVACLELQLHHQKLQSITSPDTENHQQ